MRLAGRCHCGAIHYQLEWPDACPVIPARRCSCSYCTRFRGTWTSHPEAKLEISIGHDEHLGRYRFGTGTADFLFCGTCGVNLVALSEIDGILKAVLNIATIDNHHELDFDHSESDFDGESTEERQERRAARWIAQVSIR